MNNIGVRFKRTFFFYWIAKLSTTSFMRIFYRVRVKGKENFPEKGAFIMVSNHQSFLDPMLAVMYTWRVLFFLARDTLFKGLFGQLLLKLNTRPVKRGESDLKAMRTMIDILQRGYGTCIYPEGTRTPDGRISEIKPGFLLLARKTKAPVIPFVIEGLHEIWPKTQSKPNLSGRVMVEIGEPVPYEKIQEQGAENFAKWLTDKLRQMQNDARVELGKEPFDYERLS
ncbi:lysophospholipid acyltransferase family protein [Sedimentisphaera salicampi]|uniref:1-acyl-sn-glycerol-3-phosphate acyltransferase n=1 Tax=Sedimentisphaera salicampi TaxID=1941349 RepID=A0A1W6LK11_9BACT|nr:lysophospholipid acyltransferase family protein [Sedimentisphaera salicampi]ARN56095.1 1-acyl-sn-glycerol-3-phosphate acyltransferase [Sedimentisphaera salicampi]